MAFRAFFALPADKFMTSGGAYTNAVHGFISMLATLIKNEQPTHVGVAFDAGAHTFRTEVFPQYKGTRDATPEPFKGQVALIKEVLDAMNIRYLEKDRFEADDILATWSTCAAEAGMEVLLCSGDRDTLQLVNDHVTVLYPVKGVSELKRYTPEAVEEKYGVRPEQYPDLAALVGETSDNIPGVPGVGPKTAAKWVNQFGSLTEVLNSAETIKGKVGEKLRDHLDQVRQNREINRLLTDVDLDVMPNDLTVQQWDRNKLHEIFDMLEFRTLRERLLAMMGAVDQGTHDEGGAAQGASTQIMEVAAGELAQWLSSTRQPMGLAVAGKGVPSRGTAWQIALSATPESAVVVTLDELSDADSVALRQWLMDPNYPKIVHSAKEAWHALHSFSGGVKGVIADTELAAYLAFPDQRSYGLEDLSIRYVSRDITPVAHQAQGSLDLGLDDTDDALRALANRAAVLPQLAQALDAELSDRSLTALYQEMELPLTVVLAQMEHVGVAVDLEQLRSLDAFFAHQGSEAQKAAFEAIGRQVNLGSPKQLQEVLFDQLDMPKTKKIKTGYTTDAASLADLFVKTGHPFLQHLLEYRDSTKLRQTVEGLLKSVADDGRVHTTFQQTVAATGRLSSTDPNLQNIPIRTETGRRIRQGFVVGEGFDTLLTADYSQIEMRIMAHLSQDDGLISAFQAGEDLHNFVGARVFGVSIDEVTPQMRSKVKAMSYGLAYGLSAFGLSKQLNISVGEASTLMDDYFTRFGGVRDYLTSVVARARTTGYTETIMGRRRYLPDLTSDNRQRRENAERVALNAPIQGSAADVIKQAMLGVDAAFRSEGLSSRLLLQIHDELIVEVAPGEQEIAERIVREEMAGAMQLSVPLAVSVGTGQNWHDAGH